MTLIDILYIIYHMSIKRILNNYGIYHVYNRGHNKMRIFKDSQDKTVFLSIIRKVQIIYNFQIFAYSIMPNHYHLLYKDVGKQLPKIIGLIQEMYAIYYNAKYNHSGAVFMKPFKSKPIYTKIHFFTTFIYILNNPVKAEISLVYSEYKWNSPITGYEKYNLTDYLYLQLYYEPIDGMCLHEYIKRWSRTKKISDLEIESLSDEEAEEMFNYIVKNLSGCHHFSSEVMATETMERIISEALYQGINTRQVVKFTGIPKTTVFRMKSSRTYI